MSIQIEGINFLKYVLEMVLRLGYKEPNKVEIRKYLSGYFDVRLDWSIADYEYENFVLVVDNKGNGYVFLEDFEGYCQNRGIFYFKTSDIRIIV